MKLFIITIPILFLLLCGLAYSMAQDKLADRKIQAKFNHRADFAYAHVPVVQWCRQRIIHADEMYLLGKHKR